MVLTWHCRSDLQKLYIILSVLSCVDHIVYWSWLTLVTEIIYMGRSARNLKKLKAAVKQYYELIALYLVSGHKNIQLVTYMRKEPCVVCLFTNTLNCVSLWPNRGYMGRGSYKKSMWSETYEGGAMCPMCPGTLRQLHLIHNPSLTETRWCRPNIVSYPTPNYLSVTQSLSPR